jgi:hypothetical protein
VRCGRMSAAAAGVTHRVVRLRTGHAHHHACAMLVGFAALFTWFTSRG